MKTFVFIPKEKEKEQVKDEDMLLIHAANKEAANKKLEGHGFYPQDWKIVPHSEENKVIIEDIEILGGDISHLVQIGENYESEAFHGMADTMAEQ